MRRRDFVGGLGGAAIALPLTALAQQPQRMRRIGMLMNLAEDDREEQARLALFRRALQEAGWVDGQNVKIDTRWGAGDAERYRKYAAELVALEPDVIVTATTPAVFVLRQATRSVRFCLLVSSTPSAPAWLRACRGQAPISLASFCLNTRSPQNGSAC